MLPPIHRWDTVPHARASVHIVHGMAERGGRYRRFALALNLAGFNVWAHDHRGHGTNPAPGVERAIARLQRQLLGPRTPGRWLRRLVFERYNRRFAPNRTDVDWLSRDTAEVDKYRDDPLCGFALTSQAWVDFLDGKSTLGSASQLLRVPKGLPIHVIAGTRDPVGEDGTGVERLLRASAAAALTDVTHRFYEGARHELVNETNRDEVTRDVIAWIDRVVTMRTSPEDSV
jgi:alpha-beta hydrolase superfamily lysophospholipase